MLIVFYFIIDDVYCPLLIQTKDELFQLVCSVIAANRTIFVQLQQVQVSRLKPSNLLHKPVVIPITISVATKKVIAFICMCVCL